MDKILRLQFQKVIAIGTIGSHHFLVYSCCLRKRISNMEYMILKHYGIDVNHELVRSSLGGE